MTRIRRYDAADELNRRRARLIRPAEREGEQARGGLRLCESALAPLEEVVMPFGNGERTKNDGDANGGEALRGERDCLRPGMLRNNMLRF